MAMPVSPVEQIEALLELIFVMKTGVIYKQ
jgi:hypothetical protein